MVSTKIQASVGSGPAFSDGIKAENITPDKEGDDDQEVTLVNQSAGEVDVTELEITVTLPNGNGATLTNLPISEGDCGFFRDEKISDNEVIEDDGDEDGDPIFDERCFQTGGAILDDNPWEEGESLVFRIQNTSPGQRLEEGNTVEIAVSSSRKVSASATTISFVPGLDESDFTRNVSAFPDGSPFGVPIDPDGFYGDEIQAEEPGVDSGLPKDLEEALEIRKTVDEDSLGEFEEKAYRLKNSLDIEYSVTDDGRVDTTEPIKISVNFKSPVNENLLSQPYSVEVSVDDEGLPSTVLHDAALEEYNTSGDLDVFFIGEVSGAGELEAQMAEPFTYNRYLDADIVELENPSGKEIQAIRVSTIWGAVNDLTRRLIDRAALGSGEEGGEAPGPVSDNTHVYSWIDMALLADGTRYVRIPDASVFPRHSLYVDGEKKRTNGFNASPTAGGSREYGASYTEDGNPVWDEFKRQAEAGLVVPFRSPHNIYVNEYDNQTEPDFFPGHPVMVYGVDSEGNDVDLDLVEEKLGEPNDPFPTGQL